MRPEPVEPLAKPEMLPCTCGQGFKSLEEMSVHIHRDHQTVESRPPFFDPLVEAERTELRREQGRRVGRMARKWDCDEHDFHTGSGYAWGQHKRRLHGGADPRGEAAAKPAKKVSRRGANHFGGALEELVGLRQARIDKLISGDPEIGELDVAIKALEKLKARESA